MQKNAENSLNLTFPKKYLQKLEDYRKRQTEILEKPRRIRKPHVTPNVFSSNCKQAIPFPNKTYCCAMKEMVNRSMCKACPCFEHEPLDYTLYRRV